MRERMFSASIIQKVKSLFTGQNIPFVLLGVILISLPAKNIFVSISLIVFGLYFLKTFKSLKFAAKSFLFLPVLIFILMLLSLFWSDDQKATLFGVQKELPLLILPILFFFIPKFSRINAMKIFRLFSFSMVFYALYYLIRALIKFSHTHDVNVFFYYNLVSPDPGAIYISVFASFALFYFIQTKAKNYSEKAALLILAVLIFLLSSKSIITIDFIIFICYYAFFAAIPSSTKTFTILAVSGFFLFSVNYVKEVKQKFLIEYETAFIDNTINNNTYLMKDRGEVYNVSIKDAWRKKDFHQNNFFPGTALRVYQARIFAEMLKEQNILFTGFGLEASQDQIRKKAKEHNVYFDYGEFNFHNQYIQTFAEIGVLGFILLILMLVVNLKTAWAEKDFLHLAFAITIIVLFLSESFFCRQRGVVFFITLYCIFNNIEKRKEKITE